MNGRAYQIKVFIYIPLDTLQSDVTVLFQKVSIYNKPENYSF